MRKEIDYAAYTKEQIKAARLMATLDEKLSNAEIAEQVGISERQLYRWKKDKKFMDLFTDLCEAEMDEFLSEAYRYLKKGVRSGSVKFLELYLKRSGKLIDRKEVTNDIDIQVTTIEGKTNDQLRREAIEMERKFLGNVIDAEVIDDE